MKQCGEGQMRAEDEQRKQETDQKSKEAGGKNGWVQTKRMKRKGFAISTCLRAPKDPEARGEANKKKKRKSDAAINERKLDFGQS